MTDDYGGQIDRLLEQTWGLEYSPARVALEEEAVRIADSHQHLDEGFQLRSGLIDTAIFGGFTEKALVAFSWMLAQSDREPERFPEFELLWKYKWIANNLYQFPQVSRQQIEDALADMERRYTRCGRSLKPVWKERTRFALHRKDLDCAKEYYGHWRDARGDFNNDCAACDRSFQVTYLIDTRRPRRALQVAAPLLEGRQSCAEIPHATYANVLQTLMELGEFEEAKRCHRAGYRMIAGNRVFVSEFGEHLVFLVQTGDFGKALQVVEKHLAFAMETKELAAQFQFYLAIVFLLKRLEESSKGTVKIRVPAELPIYSAEGKYATSELLGWFNARCRELAEQFDARNGTNRFWKSLGYPEGKWRVV